MRHPPAALLRGGACRGANQAGGCYVGTVAARGADTRGQAEREIASARVAGRSVAVFGSTGDGGSTHVIGGAGLDQLRRSRVQEEDDPGDGDEQCRSGFRRAQREKSVDPHEERRLDQKEHRDGHGR